MLWISLFGLGEGLLIVSAAGASPWSVLAQGISLNVELSYWNSNHCYKYTSFDFMDSIKSKTWNWTILNALIIGLMIDRLYKVCTNPRKLCFTN